jgi:phosphatidylserine/phosphatidylglycerophosphate/cardiolipin synthase-like enzyme
MHRRNPTTGTLPALLLLCGMLLAAAAPAAALGAAAEQTVGTIRFVESTPEETSLDDPDLPQAYEVWPDALNRARHSLRIASFYFSRQGDGQDAATPPGMTDHLAPILAGLPALATAGVDVKVLGDSKFLKTYPEAITWLDEQPGVAARAIDLGARWGGVMHAKYFVVDEQTLYVGSQNWDWRALGQIRELGALIEHPGLARQLAGIFDLDWQVAGQDPPAAPEHLETAGRGAPDWDDLGPASLITAGGDTCQAVLAASPPAGLPDYTAWDLPLLLATIKSARQQIHLQLLSYGVTDRENRFWPQLDNALREAAARKVQVRIILSNWAKARYSLPWLQSLAAVPNIEIKFSNIPEHSLGYAPYSRVEHPKYLTVDGRRAWLGTSNWSRDYFYESRNVSLFLRGEGAVSQLDEFFAAGWDGPYTETLDPCGSYEPPRRN